MLVAARAHRRGIPWVIAVVGSVAVIAASPGRARPADTDTSIERMVRFIDPDRATHYELFWKAGSDQHPQWSTATGLALALVRAGAHPCVPEEWKHMFGRALSPCAEPRVRVAMYETSAHHEQVRERVAIFGGTTLEMGEMLPRPLPVVFDGRSADDYFTGWSAVDATTTRWLDADRAEIRFVPGKVPSGTWSGVLQIAGRGKPGERLGISLNGDDLGTVTMNGKTALVTAAFASSSLRPFQENLLRLTRLGSRGPRTLAFGIEQLVLDVRRPAR